MVDISIVNGVIHQLISWDSMGLNGDSMRLHRDSMGLIRIYDGIPSGNCLHSLLKMAIEIVDVSIQIGDFPSLCC